MSRLGSLSGSDDLAGTSDRDFGLSMIWPTLKAVKGATRIEFPPELAGKHIFVRLPSGSYVRILGAPPSGARPVNRGRKVFYIPDSSADSFRIAAGPGRKIHPTAYVELGYEKLAAGLWRIIDLSDNQVIGPFFSTKQKLLANLDEFALSFGATPIP